MHLLFQKCVCLLYGHSMCPHAALKLSASATQSLCKKTFNMQTEHFKTGLVLIKILNRA